MDIRNFFGAKKKSSPAASAMASSPASVKKKPTPTNTPREIKSNKDSTELTKEVGTNGGGSLKNSTKGTMSMEERRRMLCQSSDDDTDVEDKKETTPAKSSPYKAVANKKDRETRSSNNRTSPRKRKGTAPDYTDKTSSSGKVDKRRKVVDESEDEFGENDDGNDDDGDDDFNGGEDMDDQSDEFDEEVEDPKPKSKQRGSVRSPGRSPPKKRTAASVETAKKSPTAAKKSKVAEVEIPKYHPPSSRLLSTIPFLKNDPVISIQQSVPKLPMKEGQSLADSFSIDHMTPLCLEGLTFVFTGVLTTNAAKAAATNAAVAIHSPSKGEYYQNRNAYTTSTMAGIGSDEELSRDLAIDIVKILGGRVTGSISGKTDYLVVGSILEDGRGVEEGSKYRKAIEMYETWRQKNSRDYGGGGGDEDAKKKRKSVKKAPDPNSLVEIITGVDEFYGLITFYSDWKKGTPRLEEQEKSEASQVTVKTDVVAQPNVEACAATVTPAVKNPYANQKKPVNPYAKSPVNPYAKSKASPSNPYAKKTSDTPPPSSEKQLMEAKPATTQINALWADKYAPSNSREILGNGDSVNKLFAWLRSWEQQFNDPKRKPKSISGPNGPWKAALLSGPPGIGKTTTATLVAKESGRDVIELNASDARSKKALTEALGDLSGTHALNFGHSGAKKTKVVARKRCIIMDEVDGMGAGDRSGISELIQMIKKSKVPIICICNDRSSQKMRSLVQYCMDLRYRRPTKNIIAKRAVEVGKLEGMVVEPNAAEAMSESCGNDIRQVLNCLQMWSCKKTDSNASSSLTFKELLERQHDINKDEVLRVSMFDAAKLIVEGSRGLANADSKTATSSLIKRSDAFFIDYMLMGLNIHQNYLKVCLGQFNNAKLKGDEETELRALNDMHDATMAMSDFGMCEEELRGVDQNWSLLPLCSILAVKVGHHAGGPNGGFLPGYPEFAGWLGKNSSRNKKVRLLQELRHHMNYKVSADAPELRMNYLPVMRQQFQELLFAKDGAKVVEAIDLLDQYGLDRDDLFDNLDEFVLTVPDSKEVKFSDLDSKSKAAFTRAYNQTAHKSEALVAEQGIKSGRKKSIISLSEIGEAGELDVVDDDMAAGDDVNEEENDEEDVEALREIFMRKKTKADSTVNKAKGRNGGSAEVRRKKK
ncbi:hypothetical protein ACHAWX_006975 [Stephanocyclus meneghinianus]